jgi:glutamyl-tRNA reductase
VSVVVIGLNHRTAPLALLERMSIADGDLDKALHDLSGRPNLRETVVLSTCNRTEIYAVAERFHGAFADVRDFLAGLAFLPPEDFADHLYVRYDEAAVGHLFAVAAGIDSAVVGESEILGQVGAAWDRARAEGTAGVGLNMLFRHALETGKRARTETSIGRHTTSVSQAAVAMAAHRLGSLAGRRVLVLGAGDMGEGVAAAVAAAGAGAVLVANRTWENAVAAAARAGGQAIRLETVGDALVDVDLLVTSTGASSIMVDHGALSAVMDRRDDRPLLVVDIAVPRDVDPAVADIDGVTLLDMDDLRAHADAGLAKRRREIGRVQAIIEDEVERHGAASTARAAAPLVGALRDRAERMRQAELERFAGRLAGLDPRERAAVEALTQGVVAKLLHDPTVRLKEAIGTPRGERLAEAITDLFDL